MSKINLEEERLKRILKGVYQPQFEAIAPENNKSKPVIVISGPTCVGKTSLSLRLASQLDGEIIVGDSMQVYTGMDIGTAKVTMQERTEVPHHLLDIRGVNEPFTVVDFFHESRLAIDSIISRNKVPIIVGGTGFYLHVLLYGPPSGPPSQKELRQTLESEMEKFSPEAMYDRLEKIDPEYARTITSHDKVKIIRALEIITLTQDKVSNLSWNTQKTPIDYDFRCWFLHRSREHLYSRVEERCDAMLDEGLLDEVTELKSTGLQDNKSAANAIGYRQCLEFLQTDQSDQDYEKLRQDFKKVTRHYVKRQFTWFRKEPEFRWLDLDVHDREIATDIISQDYLKDRRNL